MYLSADGFHFLFVQKMKQKSTLKNYVLKNLLFADAYQFYNTQKNTKSLTYTFMLECRFDSLRRLLVRISCELIYANLNLKPHEVIKHYFKRKEYFSCVKFVVEPLLSF